MKEDDYIKIFKDRGALLQNTHRVLQSKRHSKEYINKDALYIYPSTAFLLAKEMGSLFLDSTHPSSFKKEAIEGVVAPAMGAVILGHLVAYHVSNQVGRPIASYYMDKDPLSPVGFSLKRGYGEQIRGQKILLVEDIVTTGGSIKKVMEALKPYDVFVIGVVALWDRSETGIIDIPNFSSLIRKPIPSWEEKDCPMCNNNIPIELK